MSGSHRALRRGNGARHVHHHADPHPCNPSAPTPAAERQPVGIMEASAIVATTEVFCWCIDR
jgi:hypothetical protein